MFVAGAGGGQHEGVYLESVAGAGESQQFVLGVDLPTRGPQGVISLRPAVKTRTANKRFGSRKFS